MQRSIIILLVAFLPLNSFTQKKSFSELLADSVMLHASVSFCVADAQSGEPIFEYNPGTSLIPASVMKLITSATAIELLGPQYIFITSVGYSGKLNKKGILTGNIVIKGGGDPALGSPYFSDHYKDFIASWVSEIRKSGIKKIKGRVISDDSYYDYQPVPPKWLWEDEGNYYGAGVYGLSVFDNTYEIHLKTTSDSSQIFIKYIVPDECRSDLSNWLQASGTMDEGNVFAAPYSDKGWLAGSIPPNMDDFVLKASITDPPMLIARMVTEALNEAGVSVSDSPTTVRNEKQNISGNVVSITKTESPPLADIIEVLNHESVNLYAEHLLKELGKHFRNSGSSQAGLDVVKEFLKNSAVNSDGMFIEDGSGLSPLNSINARGLVRLLYYMRTKGIHFSEFYNSLPDPGSQGTLKYYFKDPDFENRLKAKSGSMTRVRSYAGYIITLSGKQLIFSIIINNYSGPSRNVISGIENILKEIISEK